jgi:hypothetical protein
MKQSCSQGHFIMTSSTAIAIFALLAFSAPAMAQESGGLGIDPSLKDGPHGLARPMQFTRMPFMTAQSVQNGMTATDHQTQNQNLISKLSGDPGYLSGFQFGTPLAASRQTQQGLYDPGYWGRHHHKNGQGTTIINNEGPLAVTVGNGNVVQQQSATGSGPIALQQVATKASGGSGNHGAANVVTGSGNIIQRAPGGN